MDIKEAEIAIASHRLLEAGRMAQELFDPLVVRMRAEDTPLFRVTILLDGRPLAALAGDEVVDVADAVASFIIHLTTRVIDE